MAKSERARRHHADRRRENNRAKQARSSHQSAPRVQGDPEDWSLENEDRAESWNVLTECGDASACLKLRTPLIRRDQPTDHQVSCPPAPFGNGQKTADFHATPSFLIDAEVSVDLPRR